MLTATKNGSFLSAFSHSSALSAVLALTVLVSGLNAARTSGRMAGGDFVIDNGVMRLTVNPRMQITPALLDSGRAVTVAATATGDPPAFYLVVGDLPVTLFRADLDKVEQTQVQDALGTGVRFALRGVSDQYEGYLYSGLKVEARVELTLYDNFPLVVLGQAHFRNLGSERLDIDRLVSSSFRLDRRMCDPEEKPWNFASYQGAALRWGRDYSLIWIDRDFDRRNFMGLDGLASREVAGGGTPLVDLWSPSAGLAVASAEPCQQWISLPVKTLEDGRVEMSLTQAPEERLGQKAALLPGDSVSTIRSLTILHHLDFFDPIRTFSQIVRDQGVGIPLTSPPLAYEPYWKSWGFRKEFTLDQIYGALPELKKVGVLWANLDDGWFDWYGDWEPVRAPGKFPGGEKDMRAFVNRIHKAGFRTSIWWYPQGVSPESAVEKEHPDWLVMNEDGSFPLSKRGVHYLCPTYPPCIDYIRGKVRRILKDWDYDGMYIDCQDLSSTPPCFNPAHHHKSPLESFQKQPEFYKAIYDEAESLKPGSPIEMCICSMPHDPFKMPYYNVADASDPVNLYQVRRRIKVEKAYRSGTFCVGDCYQVPADEWEGFSVPESFESAMGTGAQVTTFYKDLDPQQEQTWKRWIGMYRQMKLAQAEYINLYDLAFDKPEGHVVKKGDSLFYGFFADYWSWSVPIRLRGLEKGRTYKVRDYAHDKDMGTVTGDSPVLNVAFKDQLLLEVTPVK